MSVFVDGGESLREAYERVRNDGDEEAMWYVAFDIPSLYHTCTVLGSVSILGFLPSTMESSWRRRH